MSGRQPLEWESLATRLALRQTRSVGKTDAGRRVARLIPRLNASGSDTEIALELLTAASSAPLRLRLVEIQTGHTQARQSAEAAPQSPSADAGRFARAARRARAAMTGSARARETLDTQVRREITSALADATEATIDLSAVVDGLRALYEKGRLATDRVDAILRQLAHDLPPSPRYVP